MDLNQEAPLSITDFQAMTLTAATELTRLVLEANETALTHAASGAGVRVEVNLAPNVSIITYIVDSDGSAHVIAAKYFNKSLDSLALKH